MEMNLSYKIPRKYECICCQYITSYSKDYNKHLNTKKHISITKEICGNVEEMQNVLICDNCDKQFKTNSGLWKHKQKCCVKQDESLVKKDESSDNKDESSDKKDESLVKKDDIIMMLLKENSEFKTMMMEQQNMMLKIIENGTTNNDSHNTTNSHNKAFNLQFYLNETCKNAMNITEFIDSINPQLSDLISVGELGYVEGISKIIINELNKLDATKRPVNCTDKKRDTMYIKDDNIWEKDEENNKLNGVVKKVAYKNTRNFNKFKEKYPDYKDSDSVHSDKYSEIVIESLKDDRENNEKVIKNISKVTSIKEK